MRKRRGSQLALVCALFLGLCSAEASAAPQLLVKFRSGSTQAAREAVLARAGARPLRRLATLDVYVVNPTIGVRKARRILRASGAVLYAEPDLLARASDTVPNDASWSEQWGVRKVGAPRAWALPLDDSSFRKHGPWSRRSGPGYYLGNFSVATKRGATLSLAGLEARRMALVATRCRGCGVVDVLLDGKRLKRINLASTGLHKLQVIQVASFPGVRHGTVLLRVASSGKPVRIEGFGVSRA